MKERLKETAGEMLQQASDNLVATVPNILLALGVLISGVIIAFVLKKIVLRLFDMIGLDKLAGKVNIDRALHTVGIRSSVSEIFGLLVYWLILLFALLLVSETLELQAISEAIGSIVNYIPRIIIGLLLLVAGLLLGRFFRDVVSTSFARAGITSSLMTGYAIQGVIVIFVCLVALKQIGFDISIITTNISVILGGVLISAGLAIALAIRPVLQNYFACRQIRAYLRKGDTIRCGDMEGEIVSFSLTGLVVRSGNEDTIIPALMLFEQRFTKRVVTDNNRN